VPPVTRPEEAAIRAVMNLRTVIPPERTASRFTLSAKLTAAILARPLVSILFAEPTTVGP